MYFMDVMVIIGHWNKGLRDGQPLMKFGLIVPDKKKPISITVTSKSKTASIFDEEDDEEKELAALRKAKTSAPVSKSITTSDQFVDKLHKEALNEDPNIFDYDAALETDDMNRKNVHRNSRYAGTIGKTEAESKTEPKYMQNILAKAEERKIESELIKLRNMKRKSGESEANEEVFVTSAYKSRLLELEEKEKELKSLQIREEDGDVKKRKDMTGFYYNLMKRNVSFGGKLSEFDDPKKPKLVNVEDTKVSELSEVSEVSDEVSEVYDEVSEVSGVYDDIITGPHSSTIITEPSVDEQIVFGPRRPPVKK